MCVHNSLKKLVLVEVTMMEPEEFLNQHVPVGSSIMRISATMMLKSRWPVGSPIMAGTVPPFAYAIPQ